MKAEHPKADTENIHPAKKPNFVDKDVSFDTVSFCSNRPLDLDTIYESEGSTLNSVAKQRVQNLFRRDHLSLIKVPTSNK